MTMQTVNVRTDVDNDHWPVAQRIAWIRRLPEYDGHTLDIEPVVSEDTGIAGGYRIAHGDCCPDRVDARILPPAIHRVAFLGPDIPHLIAAIEQYGGDWQRRERILGKFRALVAPSQEARRD